MLLESSLLRFQGLLVYFTISVVTQKKGKKAVKIDRGAKQRIEGQES